MSKAICIMGESGSGKTTSMRTLDPSTTFYFDCDGKGLAWKEWRAQYNKEKKNFKSTRDIQKIDGLLRTDRKSTRLNSSHSGESRMPSSA